MCKYGLKLERWSLISTSGSRVGLNVIDNLINILDCFCPFQVFVTILSFLIEQLCGLKLGFKTSSVFGSSQSSSEFFNLCLTFREVRYEPDESFLGIRHGLEHALGLLSDYMKRKRNRLVSFKITIRATFQREVWYLPTKLATGLRVFSCLITNWMDFSSRFRMSLAFPIPRSFHCSSRHRKSLVLIFIRHSKFSSPEATAYFGILTYSKTRQFKLVFNEKNLLE